MSSDSPFASPVYAGKMTADPTESISAVGLSMTRVGLFVVYYSICAILLSFVALPVIAFAMRGNGATVAITSILFLGLVGGSLGILVGQALCASVPAHTGSKGFAITTVVLQAIGVIWTAIVMGVSMVAETSSRARSTMFVESTRWSGMVTVILGFASFICFLLFLRRLATYLQRSDLAGSVSTVLWVIALLVFLYAGLIGGLIYNQANGDPPVVAPIAAILGISIFVAGIVAFIKYANAVIYLAKAIPRDAPN